MHPSLAERSCDDCKKWVFEDDSAIPAKRLDQPIERRGSPPCHTCPKCASEDDKTPEVGKRCELSYRNWVTLRRYYEQCAAPSGVDAIARKNFGIIRMVEARLTAAERRRLETLLRVLISCK